MTMKDRRLQVKYVTAQSPAELEAEVNECLEKDNRWALQGDVNVFDKPNVAEDRVWVQTLVRYVGLSERDNDERDR